jgi:hypothetical protein
MVVTSSVIMKVVITILLLITTIITTVITIEITIDIQSLYNSFNLSILSQECKYMTPGQAKSTLIPLPHQGYHSYFLDQLGYKHHNSTGYYLFHTPCINYHSFGNRLGFYFETLLCSKKLGSSYIVSRLVNETSNDIFFKFLPTLIDNHHNHHNHHHQYDHHNQYDSNNILDYEKVMSLCPCNDFCHESNKSLIYQYIDTITTIFTTALDEQIKYMKENNLIHVNITKVNKGNDQDLPLIPDVALHYRCSDNSYYGIMPFKIYTDRIPHDSKYIYIISESPSRKLQPRTQIYCKAIIESFYNYIQKLFPLSIVSIFKGNNIYLDLARLTYAKTTVCSVSTFCLWPAISSSNTVHYPISEYIASSSTIFIKPNFNWITEPMLVKAFGSQNLHVLIAYLKTGSPK